MTPRRRLLLGAFALAALVFTAGCVDFPPNPMVYLACETGVEHATGDRLNVSVDHSELRIRVREDGTARWTVRSELTGPDVETMRADPSRVDQLADRAVTDSVRVGSIVHYSTHGGDVENVSARMTDDTLVITFAVADVAERGVGGVLLLDHFHSEGQRPRSRLLGADRVVVRGPSGTVITNQPPGASVTDGGQAIVWRSSETRVSGDTYVAFGPDDRRTTRLATAATIAAAVAGWVAPETLRVGLPYAVILLVVIVLLSDNVADRSPIRFGDPEDPLPARVASDPPVDVAAVTLLLVAGTAGIVADVGGVGRAMARVLLTWPLLGPGLFLLLGYSVERSQRWSRSLSFAIAGLPFLMASWYVVNPPRWPFDSSVYANDSLLVAVIGLLLVGAPLFYVGYAWRPQE